MLGLGRRMLLACPCFAVCRRVEALRCHLVLEIPDDDVSVKRPRRQQTLPTGVDAGDVIAVVVNRVEPARSRGIWESGAVQSQQITVLNRCEKLLKSLQHNRH